MTNELKDRSYTCLFATFSSERAQEKFTSQAEHPSHGRRTINRKYQSISIGNIARTQTR